MRTAALAADPIDPPKAMVTPVEQRDGISRRIGMKAIVEAMLRQCENAGVRVFYGAKVTFLEKAYPRSKRVLIKFADGRRVVSRKVILNIGKPDLMGMFCGRVEGTFCFCRLYSAPICYVIIDC